MLVGGHTIIDEELKFGLSVTGQAQPARLLTNAARTRGRRPRAHEAARHRAPRDRAAKQDRLTDAARARRCTRRMRTLNAAASRAALAARRRGAPPTSPASGCSVTRRTSRAPATSRCASTARALPELPGARALWRAGVRTGGAERNESYLAPLVDWSARTRRRRRARARSADVGRPARGRASRARRGLSFARRGQRRHRRGGTARDQAASCSSEHGEWMGPGGFLVFKTTARRIASWVGSIPMHSRHALASPASLARGDAAHARAGVVVAGARVAAPSRRAARATAPRVRARRAAAPRRHRRGVTVPTPPLSPRRAFLYSLLAPGYWRSRVLGRPTAGAIFVLSESIAHRDAARVAADLTPGEARFRAPTRSSSSARSAPPARRVTAAARRVHRRAGRASRAGTCRGLDRLPRREPPVRRRRRLRRRAPLGPARADRACAATPTAAPCSPRGSAGERTPTARRGAHRRLRLRARRPHRGARASCGSCPTRASSTSATPRACPYGPKRPDTVRRYSREIAAYLLEQGVKAIVVACNTATAHALPDAARGAATCP